MTNIEPINKAQVWHRVRTEGRLEAFDKRREQTRTEWREKGLARRESADQAWRKAAEEFAPLPVEETPADA